MGNRKYRGTVLGAGRGRFWLFQLVSALLASLALAQGGLAATPTASNVALVHAYGAASVTAAAPVVDPGDTITISITAQPTDGVVSVVGTDLTFTPTGGTSAVFSTVNTFTYQACDQNALCASANGTVVQSCPTPSVSAASVSPSPVNDQIGGTMRATYTAAACLTNPVLTSSLTGGVQVVSSPVTSFGAAQIAVVGTFAPRAAGNTSVRTWITADYRTGAISGGVPVSASYTSSNVTSFYTVVVATAPSAPTGVSATDGTGPTGKVTVSWTAVSGATNYEVQRTPALGGATVSVATGVTGTSFDDTVSDAATYNYEVRAYVGTLAGAWSIADGGYASQSAANTPPTAGAVHIVHPYGAANASAAAAVADADAGDTLTVTITAQPAEGTVSVSGTTLTFTPNSLIVPFAGPNTFTYQVSDGVNPPVAGAGTVGQSCPAPSIAPTATASTPSTILDTTTDAAISATYTAAACVTNAQIVSTVKNANAEVFATLTQPITTFGAGQVAQMGTLPGLWGGTHTLRSDFTAQYRTGAIVNGQLETATYSGSAIALIRVNQTPLDPPAQVLAAAGAQANAVALTWTPVTYATSYDVVRTTGGTPTTIATGVANTAYADTLLSSASYTYSVRAVRGPAANPTADAMNYGPYGASGLYDYASTPLAAPAVHIVHPYGAASAAADVTVANGTTVTITSQPAEGTVSVSGSTLTFTPTSLTVPFVGPNSFTYQVTDGVSTPGTGTGTIGQSCPAPSIAPTATSSTPGTILDTTTDAVISATYTAQPCVTNAQIVSTVKNVNNELFATLTQPVTVFGADQVASMGTLPGLWGGTHTLRSDFTAQYRTGAIVNGQLETATYSGAAIALIRVNQTPLDPPAQVLAAAGAQPNKVALTWAQVANATAYDVVRTTGGTPTTIATGVTGTAATDTLLTSASYSYSVRAVRGPAANPAADAMNYGPYAASDAYVYAGVPPEFQFKGVLAVKRLVQNVQVFMSQKAGDACRMVVDAAAAALATPRDKRAACLITFAALPAGLELKGFPTGDRVLITGRASAVTTAPLAYDVSKRNADGTFTVIATGTLALDVQIAPAPVAKFVPMKQTGVADQFSYAPNGALGRVLISQAAGAVKMEVVVDGVTRETVLNLRAGASRFIAPPAGMTLWDSKAIKAILSYQDDPSVSTEVNLTAVAGLPDRMALTMTAPATALDTDTAVQFDVDLAAVVSKLKTADASVIGNWKVHLAKYVGKAREIVALTTPVDMVAGKASISLPPSGPSMAVFAIAEPVLPAGLVVEKATVISPVKTVMVRKGSAIAGSIAAIYKRVNASVVNAFITVTVDPANRIAMGSFSWLSSVDGGVTWVPDDVKLLTRVLPATAQPKLLKVKFVNKYSNVESETASVEINVASAPAYAGRVAAVSSVASDSMVPAGSADKPIALKLYPSNATLRAPVVLALQSLTNTGSGVYDWDVNGTLVPNQHTYKAAVTLELPGTYIIRARSGVNGEFEGVQTVTVIANQVPVCTLDPQPVVGGLRVVANCADPDGRLRGWQWSLNGRDLSTIGSSLLVPLKAGEQALVGIRVWDDSRGEAQFSRTVSMQ